MHEENAHLYDAVYHKHFGTIYDRFTADSLRMVRRLLPQKKVIVDHGAGTGRLAIPLAQEGYTVHAADISPDMCSQMRQKVADGGVANLTIHDASMAQYDGPSGDLSLAVFTVLSYITTDEEMEASIKNVSDKSHAGGLFLFDLPHRLWFSGHFTENRDLPDYRREVIPFRNKI